MEELSRKNVADQDGSRDSIMNTFADNSASFLKTSNMDKSQSMLVEEP